MDASAEKCIVCNRAGTSRDCELCSEPMCKRCTQFLAAGSFSFMSEVPPSLTHSFYCQNCFDETVTPARENYDATMEEARKVFVFQRGHKRPPRLLDRAKKPITVENCVDRDETFLRMGYFAVEAGFNALVDVVVTSAKVRHEGYQTSAWKGVGTPAQVDAEKLNRLDEMLGKTRE